MWADQAFYKLLSDYDFDTVLDVGSGTGEHSKMFRDHGKHVTTIDLTQPADITGDFLSCPPELVSESPYACIWSSHVLEHQTNVGAFLERCFYLLDDDGILAITVPPLKHEIVGGHVSLWNAGLLLYNLVLAGFDCSQAAVKTYGYNISVIVRKKPAKMPRLCMDSGDINALKRFFPMVVDEGFIGQIDQINWNKTE